VNGSGLHGRDVTDAAFYEWLLSDHPDARAERDSRRTATHKADTDRAAAVRAWADKITAQPDAPQTLRDLAASMAPQADQAAARAEARYAEPDDAYVTRLRTQHETHMQVSGPSGSPDYRYPAHLVGPGAGAYRPPPQPDVPRTRTGGRRMIPANSPRRAAGRDADPRSDQRNQARARGQVPAPSVRPAHLVRLQFPSGHVPATPDAACTSHDPELWFSPFPQAIAQAKAICHRCAHRLSCLSGAIERRETRGIWGGTDFNPRHQEDVA
jgi:hypothetical protein